MFCSKCGKPLADGANFCSACGAGRNGVPPAPKKAGSGIAPLAVIAAVGVIILLTALLGSAFGGKESGSDNGGYSVTTTENGTEQTEQLRQTEQTEQLRQTEQTSQTEATTVAAQKGGKGVLPSPDAFFGGNLARLYDKDDYDTDSDGRLESKGWKLTFKSTSEAMEGFKAYAELIGGGQYAVTLAEYWEETVWASKYFKYVFECDGSDDPEESFYQLLENDKPMQGDLLLEIANHGNTGVCYLILHYDPEYFTFVDSGEEYPTVLSDLSGVSNNSSDVPSSGGSTIKTPCPLCDDGDCKKCGGDGLIYSYALDSYDAIICGAAYCDNGSCTNCGGDGWLD